MYYKRLSGYYPPEAEVEDHGDGTYTVHLYEIVNDGDNAWHTATSAWYTVDAAGVGIDDIFGTAVDLAAWSRTGSESEQGLQHNFSFCCRSCFCLNSTFLKAFIKKKVQESGKLS